MTAEKNLQLAKKVLDAVELSPTELVGSEEKRKFALRLVQIFQKHRSEHLRYNELLIQLGENSSAKSVFQEINDELIEPFVNALGEELQWRLISALLPCLDKVRTQLATLKREQDK